NSRRIYLVDPLGFDNTHGSDVEIFKEMAVFLGQVYRSGARLGGVLYCHRITDNRISGSALRSFTLLKKLCGPDAAKFVILITIMWDSI
ncbi:hypothetical protein EDB80DRAFT_530557, partial [Ilyonectria destructans]